MTCALKIVRQYPTSELVKFTCAPILRVYAHRMAAPLAGAKGTVYKYSNPFVLAPGISASSSLDVTGGYTHVRNGWTKRHLIVCIMWPSLVNLFLVKPKTHNSRKVNAHLGNTVSRTPVEGFCEKGLLTGSWSVLSVNDWPEGSGRGGGVPQQLSRGVHCTNIGLLLQQLRPELSVY